MESLPINSMESLPINSMESLPINSMESLPINSMESLPINSMESLPINSVESLPINSMESLPINSVESLPINSVESLPINSMESLPINSVESLPINSVESLPINSVESLPINSVESLPINSVESLPINSIESSSNPITESLQDPSMHSSTNSKSYDYISKKQLIKRRKKMQEMQKQVVANTTRNKENKYLRKFMTNIRSKFIMEEQMGYKYFEVKYETTDMVINNAKVHKFAMKGTCFIIIGDLQMKSKLALEIDPAYKVDSVLKEQSDFLERIKAKEEKNTVSK